MLFVSLTANIYVTYIEVNWVGIGVLYWVRRVAWGRKVAWSGRGWEKTEQIMN